MRTQVCITVDVEFTIGGAFADPVGRRPIGVESVTCPVGNVGGGLEFILQTLEQHGLRGVFFVEALNTCYFGDDPMGSIARQIRDRGHDVELHLHPCWTAFLRPDWAAAVKLRNPSDSFVGMEEKDMEELLAMGLAVFSRWNLSRPTAFRAGNLQVDGNIYPILKRLGVPMASNVGLGVYHPQHPALCLAGGRHWIDGVVELPVASYHDLALGAYQRWKAFTVIGTGAREAEELLASAAKSNTGPVVLLTHPSEFVRQTSDDYRALRFNTLVRNRLLKLCRFLSTHKDKFEVTTFRDQLPSWTANPGTANPQWRVTPMAIARRVIENKLSAF